MIDKKTMRGYTEKLVAEQDAKKAAAKLPEHQQVRNLFYLDAKFLVELAKTGQELVDTGSDHAKHAFSEKLRLLQDCITTQKALLKAENEKERIAINGGAALLPDWKEKRKKLRASK